MMIELSPDALREFVRSLTYALGAGALRAKGLSLADAWEQREGMLENARERLRLCAEDRAALQQRADTLEREVCTCPWPADAARTRHLLACRLMQMEHAAIAAAGEEIP